MGNTHPTWGGLGYGQYMVSHNVNPHRQPNNPKVNQVTQSAELANMKYEHIKEKYHRTDDYVPKKTRNEYVLSSNEVKDAQNALSLEAVMRDDAQKGADKLEVRPFYKPELMRTDVFASKDNSPRESEKSNSRGKKKQITYYLASMLKNS